jgi:hypothetical protein
VLQDYYSASPNGGAQTPGVGQGFKKKAFFAENGLETALF